MIFEGMDKVNTLLAAINIELADDQENCNTVQTIVSAKQKEVLVVIREVLERAIDKGVLRAEENAVIFRPSRPWKGSAEVRFEEPDGRVLIATDRHEGNYAKMAEAAAVWSKTETFSSISSLKRQDAEVLNMFILAFQLCIN